MALNLERTWRYEALAFVCAFGAVALPGAALEFTMFTGQWWLAVAMGVLLLIGSAGAWYALTLVAQSRTTAVEMALEARDSIAGIERLRLRVIIHTAMRAAIGLTGDPHAEDLVSVDQLDYLVEHTVDALIATSPAYERNDDG